LAVAHWQDALFLVGLVGLNAFARWVRLEPIENGGDPLDAWYFVRQWAHENHPATARLNHHTARFGMHWITWLVQVIGGTHPRYYYYPQLIASCATVGLTYLLGRQVKGKLVGALAALWLMQYGLFHSASCQLRRGIFEAMYGALAVNCLVFYLGQREERAQRRAIVACAVATFLAYLVELPSLYICPGVALAVWLARRNVKHIVIYAAVLLGLFAVETSAYLLFTHYSSRLGVLESPGGHLSLKLRGGHEGVSFNYLLERFTKALRSTQQIYYPFFVLGPLLVWRGGPKARAVALAGISYCLFMTFFVRGINPIRVFQLNGDRYLLLGVPLALVAVLAAVQTALEFGVGRLALDLRRLPPAVRRYAGWAGPVALVAVLLWLGRDAWDKAPIPHALEGVNQAYDLINDAYARGLPIVARLDPKRGPEPPHRSRGLHWASKGFVRDEFMMKGDTLPDFSYVSGIAVLDDKYRFVPPGLEPERARQLVDDRCAVKLKMVGSNVEVSPSSHALPARCGR
jgi:hypothetical protein